MAQLTDVGIRRVMPGSKPVADAAVPGLRFEPGRIRGVGKWTLRFTSPLTGKRRDMGLGTYPEVSIANARASGVAARTKIANRVDPIEERRAADLARRAVTHATTFEEAARRVHDELKPGWKNTKHADQWLNTLAFYAFPIIGKMAVAELQPAHFADVLRPIWLTKPETASRLKQRCHRVMSWCWAHGGVPGNPVDVVGHLLPKQDGLRERVRHHPAMPWRDIPSFAERALRGGRTNVTRALLEFVILTAARSGEARGMIWDEVDLLMKVWTIPASRMKGKIVHRVPISERALEVLFAQRALCPDPHLVFPAPRGGVLSDMALTKFLRDNGARSSESGRAATAHGFRSSFRDWASENGYGRDLAERALAHAIPNQSEAAYHRTDLLEQRRSIMQAWADHVHGVKTPKVLPIRRLA